MCALWVGESCVCTVGELLSMCVHHILLHIHTMHTFHIHTTHSSHMCTGRKSVLSNVQHEQLGQVWAKHLRMMVCVAVVCVYVLLLCVTLHVDCIALPHAETRHPPMQTQPHISTTSHNNKNTPTNHIITHHTPTTTHTPPHSGLGWGASDETTRYTYQSLMRDANGRRWHALIAGANAEGVPWYYTQVFKPTQPIQLEQYASSMARFSSGACV